MNVLGSEAAAVCGVIDPDANAIGTVVSDYVSLNDFETVMAVIMAGTLGTSAAINAKLVQATDSSGAGSKDITGKLITQFTQAGTDSDKQSVINCRSEELDVDNLFTHVAVSMTTTVATSDSAAILLGMFPRRAPASDYDVASVSEIV